MIHGLVENTTTFKELTEICDSIHFNKECMVKIARLGSLNMSLPNTERIRPVKIILTLRSTNGILCTGTTAGFTERELSLLLTSRRKKGTVDTD